MASLVFYEAIDMRTMNGIDFAAQSSSGIAMIALTGDYATLEAAPYYHRLWGSGFSSATGSLPYTGTVTTWSFGQYVYVPNPVYPFVPPFITVEQTIWAFNGISIAAATFAAAMNGNNMVALSSYLLSGNDSISGALGSDILLGYGGNDGIIGGGGNDIINGGEGADSMSGGLGNDIFIVDNVADNVSEDAGEGTDTVKAFVTFTLAVNVENLILVGSAAIDGTGNAAANSLTGNGAANRLNGAAGADIMRGGAGNDTYYVDNSGDQMIEAVGAGTDSVKSSISVTLGSNVENLLLTGATAANGTGNSVANVLIGNAYANRLNGGGGNDDLRGMDGSDTLAGGAGNDRLTGGNQADKFLFNSALSAATNVDNILDFSVPADTIVLDQTIFAALTSGAVIPVSAFHAGAAAADALDRIIYNSANGNIYYDADGNGAGAQILFAHVAAGTALTNADFLVVA